MSDQAIDEQLAANAHRAVTDFVNSQVCASRDEVERALHALSRMSLAALDAVKNGTMERLS